MKIVFAGTPDFSLSTLQALLDTDHSVCAAYTQPDRPAGRGRKLTPSPIKLLAIRHNIPVYQPVSFKRQEIEQLNDLNADVMVVVAYGLILPQAVLDSPRLGCVNVHASLLPRWRGAAPIQRALEAGDKVTGITIMQMEAGLDSGPVLHKLTCSISENETAGELHDRLSQLGAKALLEILPKIGSRVIEAIPQDGIDVSYAAKIEKAEAPIDWSKPAIDIARKIRAFNPGPVAQTRYNGQWLRIWNAVPSDEPSQLPFGTVISDNKKILSVATGDRLLNLLEVQMPGGKRMKIQAFLNAHEIDGDVLG